MRQIRPEMVAFLDKKLAENGLAQEALVKKDARALMLQAAIACVGIREQGGNNRGPMVSLIQDTVGGPDPWAWCMSFVQTCIAYAEHKCGVKSPIIAGEHVLSVWNAAKPEHKVKTFPLPGAIIIWQHGQTTQGHTGFVLGANTETMMSVEGNTESGLSDTGKVERDGGGVYQCRRSMKQNGSMKVLGFLKPF